MMKIEVKMRIKKGRGIKDDKYEEEKDKEDQRDK